MSAYDVVIPTTGRPSLAALLRALAHGTGPEPGRVILVDDRRGGGGAPLRTGELGPLGDRLLVVRGPGQGPAAARNAGWRRASAPWVAFLDDDVVPAPRWRADLLGDLAAAGPRVAGVQGRVRVPLPAERRPTDWERNVAGLQSALFATADLAYRRDALAAVGGFDERFPRAYREDSDIALRLTDRGLSIAAGEREVLHPVPPADRWVSVRRQAGNADDALMRALHGRDWRERAGAPPGRLPRHLLTSACGALALAGALSGRGRRLAAAAGAAWLAGTAELAWARIAPGPRSPEELTTMALTSAVLPFAAGGHRAAGELRARRGRRPGPRALRAVLLDRDGTLVHDVPYNGDPARVHPIEGVREALARLRDAGVALAIVSNQSGVARGLLGEADVCAVNARVDALLGPFDVIRVCPHAPGAGCGCRKPAPGMLLEVALELGVPAASCAMIGDIAADVQAGEAAGMRAVMVPTERTRRLEVAAAPEIAGSLAEAVDRLLGSVDPAGVRAERAVA